MRYYLIGPYPPPLGGVSVYIYRYSKELKAEGQEVEIVDFGKNTMFERIVILLKFIFTPRRAVFHLNGFDFYAMVALILRPFGGRIIFHDHSGRLIKTFNKIKGVIFSLFLKKVNECVLVGEHLQSYYRQYSYELPRNTIVKHAFIPPPLEEEPRIWETYEHETLEFIQRHTPLLIANASKITFYEGIDLYGLDMCIELIGELKKPYSNIGLIFALAEIGDPDYYEKMKKRIQELGIQENFYFLTGQKELWPLFKMANIMIRPTYDDGYGISIAEALYFGCRAIASDVCLRPEGTVLCKNREINDLVDKVRRVIDDLSR